MPGSATPYRGWKVVRFHLWLKRLTLTQYALFTGAYTLVTTGIVMAFVWWLVPHAWLPQPPLTFALAFVAGFTLLWTALCTRQRRNGLRQDNDGLP